MRLRVSCGHHLHPRSWDSPLPWVQAHLLNRWIDEAHRAKLAFSCLMRSSSCSARFHHSNNQLFPQFTLCYESTIWGTRGRLATIQTKIQICILLQFGLCTLLPQQQKIKERRGIITIKRSSDNYILSWGLLIPNQAPDPPNDHDDLVHLFTSKNLKCGQIWRSRFQKKKKIWCKLIIVIMTCVCRSTARGHPCRESVSREGDWQPDWKKKNLSQLANQQVQDTASMLIALDMG